MHLFTVECLRTMKEASYYKYFLMFRLLTLEISLLKKKNAGKAIAPHKKKLVSLGTR